MWFYFHRWEVIVVFKTFSLYITDYHLYSFFKYVDLAIFYSQTNNDIFYIHYQYFNTFIKQECVQKNTLTKTWSGTDRRLNRRTNELTNGQTDTKTKKHFASKMGIKIKKISFLSIYTTYLSLFLKPFAVIETTNPEHILHGIPEFWKPIKFTVSENNLWLVYTIHWTGILLT